MPARLSGEKPLALRSWLVISAISNCSVKPLAPMTICCACAEAPSDRPTKPAAARAVKSLRPIISFSLFSPAAKDSTHCHDAARHDKGRQSPEQEVEDDGENSGWDGAGEHHRRLEKVYPREDQLAEPAAADQEGERHG